MKLHLINESNEILLVEQAFSTSTMNEGVMNIVTNALEVVGATAGLLPFVGDAVGDIPLVIMNIMQDDYLGAALYAIAAIPEPTNLTDGIAKALRIVQKLAKGSGQEDRINRFLKWIFEKTPGGQLVSFVKDMWNKFKQMIFGVDTDSVEKIKTKNKKEKKAAGITATVFEKIKPHTNKMEKELDQFLKLIMNKKDKIDVAAGFDMPDEYSEYMAGEIKTTYHDILNNYGPDNALKYRNRIWKNSRGKPEIKNAYEMVFGKRIDIQ